MTSEDEALPQTSPDEQPPRLSRRARRHPRPDGTGTGRSSRPAARWKYRHAFYTALAVLMLTACVPPTPAGSPSQEHWFAIGRCEQPGSGLGGVDWTVHSDTYSGGLGFANSTWTEYRDPAMPENAGDATPAQQMWVADVLWARYGPDPWGCKTDVP